MTIENRIRTFAAAVPAAALLLTLAACDAPPDDASTRADRDAPGLTLAAGQPTDLSLAGGSVRTRRPFLAVVQPVTKRNAEMLRVWPPHGVVVLNVPGGGAAAAAGLKADDVIIAVDGTPLKGVNDFRNRIDFASADRPLALTVVRGPVQVALQVRF
jgi:S1-C subfamily serine protease